MQSKIDLNELQRILRIKNDFENGLVDSNLIDARDLEIINGIYEIELQNENQKIKELKEEVKSLYSKMDDLIKEIDEYKNKEESKIWITMKY